MLWYPSTLNFTNATCRVVKNSAPARWNRGTGSWKQGRNYHCGSLVGFGTWRDRHKYPEQWAQCWTSLTPTQRETKATTWQSGCATVPISIASGGLVRGRHDFADWLWTNLVRRAPAVGGPDFDAWWAGLVLGLKWRECRGAIKWKQPGQLSPEAGSP